jgi:hypothetical protein
MLFDLSNPFQLQDYKEYVNKLYKQGAVVRVEKVNHKRTLNQNSYLHFCLSYFACEYGCSVDEAKIDYFKRLVNRDLFVTKYTNKFGVEIERLRSTADLDKEEMRVAIDRFKNWAAKYVYIPDADENKAIVYAQQKIEKVKNYL